MRALSSTHMHGQVYPHARTPTHSHTRTPTLTHAHSPTHTHAHTNPQTRAQSPTHTCTRCDARAVSENGHVTLTIETPTIDAPMTPEPPAEILPAVDVTLPPPAAPACPPTADASAGADHPCLSTAISRERLLPSEDSTATIEDDIPAGSTDQL